MKALPFIIQGSNIVVIVDNKPHTITESNLNYKKLKEAIKLGNWDAVPDLVTPVKAISTYIGEQFTLIDGVVYENGVQVSDAITKRILSLYTEGFPVDPLINFYKNIKRNPSKASADELYGFLEKNSLPVTDDGCFVAYKRVNDDYTDCYSGKIDNSIGKVVSMPRAGVDDDRKRTCSSGLHFCSHEYLAHFGGARVVVVKINPADVVSIPSDYNNAKGRCCKYEVVGEISCEDATKDSLSGVAVYNSDHDTDYIDANETDSWQVILGLGLRKQAQIYNKLSGSNIKKFSYAKDAETRLFDKYPEKLITDTAKALKLV
jgi:hypothetical protein